MSVVLSLPPHPPSPHLYPLSRSATPTSSSKPPSHSRPSTPPAHAVSRRIRSRPCTPPPPLAPSSQLNPMQPISAPPTPVTTTHLIPISMERCRSSEAVLASSLDPTAGRDTRDGRRRDVKATSLLFNTIPSPEEISSVEAAKPLEKPTIIGDSHHHEMPMEIAMEEDEDDEMDVDEVEVETTTDDAHRVWGMPKWGWEEERKEVRKGVRLVGMEELPGLVEQHALIDTPSHVLFPWMHGISDDGRKGQDMGAFFGHSPPFEPPSYRGLCLVLAPRHPLDATRIIPRGSRGARNRNKSPQSADPPLTTTQPPPTPSPEFREPRERSETMSTSSESYHSSGTTEGTSPSVGDFKDPSCLSPSPWSPSFDVAAPINAVVEADVQMHPCESKRVSAKAVAQGLDEPHHPVPCELSPSPTTFLGAIVDSSTDTSSSEEEQEEEEAEEEDAGPSCLLLNALHAQNIFDLPKPGSFTSARFRPVRLPNQINLRNLNIQQIKYSTISDIVLYAEGGVGNGVLAIAEKIAQAQDDLWQARMVDFYAHQSRGEGEGLNLPVRYGVWVLVEPFHKIEKHCPHLVNIDHSGNFTSNSHHTDLFDREAKESRAMTRGTEVLEGLWVGNDCDIPGGADDGVGASIPFDLCVRASECCDMPVPSAFTVAQRKLLEADKRKDEMVEEDHAWVPSPATIALRSLLSPSTSPQPLPDVGSKRGGSPPPNATRQRRRRSNSQEDYVSIDCAGSCRTITGQWRNLAVMTERMVDFVYFLRKIIEGRDQSGRKRRVLVHCQDGYTESSILVLCYIMSSLSISLPEAFLHLQLNAGRSFFLYPADKPLLRRVDARLAADQRAKAIRLVSSPTQTPSVSPTRWKNWGLGFGKSGDSTIPSNDATPERKKAVDEAKTLLEDEAADGSNNAAEAKVWFEDRRFDGFPSRILPFLYLGNLEHASNAAMLSAIGISHVVSVGESLVNCPQDCEALYGHNQKYTLCGAVRVGTIQVLDLTDVRDDGNDPLRPLIARACEWIEAARRDGGCVLVHCRVGVSRSASIVIAYMMQYEGMGLMDAYLITRARRLNVLIQPNLRFFHELFGWEVELARREMNQASRQDEDDVAATNEKGQRRIVYSWPSFCRDLHCLNRRFLCN